MFRVISFKATEHFVTPIFKRKFPDPEEFDSKLEKQKDFMMKMSIYTVFTVYGLVVMRDANYFPTFFGGSGDVNKIYEGYPLLSNRP